LSQRPEGKGGPRGTDTWGVPPNAQRTSNSPRDDAEERRHPELRVREAPRWGLTIEALRLTLLVAVVAVAVRCPARRLRGSAVRRRLVHADRVAPAGPQRRDLPPPPLAQLQNVPTGARTQPGGRRQGSDEPALVHGWDGGAEARGARVTRRQRQPSPPHRRTDSMRHLSRQHDDSAGARDGRWRRRHDVDQPVHLDPV